MSQRPRVRDRSLHGLHRLGRISERPVRKRAYISADNAGILAVAHQASVVLIWVIEIQTLAAVVPCIDELALPPGGVGQHPVSHRNDERVLLRLSQLEEL